MDRFISWVEIPTIDFDRAVQFYNSVFKLNLKKEDYGKEKMACLPSGEGAIIFAENFSPSENGIMISLNVPDSIEKTVERIVTNGGKVLRQKTRIEVDGRDYFAICSDTEGNRIGLYGK